MAPFNQPVYARKGHLTTALSKRWLVDTRFLAAGKVVSLAPAQAALLAFDMVYHADGRQAAMEENKVDRRTDSCPFSGGKRPAGRSQEKPASKPHTMTALLLYIQ